MSSKPPKRRMLRMLRMQVTLAMPQVALMRSQQALFGISVSEQIRRALDEAYGTDHTVFYGTKQLTEANL